MKKIFFLLPVLLLFSCSEDALKLSETEQSSVLVARPNGNSATTIDSKSLFNLDNVPLITLQFTEVEWNKLLTNFDLNPKNDKKVEANFSYFLNGQLTEVNAIGLKLKGNTSRRRPEGQSGQLHDAINPTWHHCHFSLDFDKNVPNQRFSGREKMVLKWFKDDADYAREVYCYDLFRRFGIWTAPRMSYCRLNIKVGNTPTANYGVYGLVESVDEDFITVRKHHWTATIGDLWKGGWDANGQNANFVSTQSMGVEEVTLDPNTSIYYAYDLKTNEDDLVAAKANLSQFISDLNTKTGSDFEQWINSKLDVPLFLRTYAVNVVVGMWDDYWVNGNNYYFYFAGDGKAYFIPYDYDNTLGTSLIISNSGTQNPLNWGGSNKPLITKLLQIPAYRNLYKAAIDRLLDPSFDLFAASRSIPRIQAWQIKIAPYISNDTGQDMSLGDYPASWGNQPNYRLLSGNSQAGNNGAANYFSSRSANIPW